MDTCNTRGVTSALPYSLGETQRKRCFTPVFCEAVVSLRSSRPRKQRPIRAEAWLSHGKLSKAIMKNICSWLWLSGKLRCTLWMRLKHLHNIGAILTHLFLQSIMLQLNIINYQSMRIYCYMHLILARSSSEELIWCLTSVALNRQFN